MFEYLFGYLFSGNEAHPNTWNTAYHHPNKEGRVAAHEPLEPQIEKTLQLAGEHARNHHAQSHESRAKGVMRGLVLSLTKMQQIGGIGGESVAVTQLFQPDASVYGCLALYLAYRHEQVHQVGQTKRPCHGENTFLKPSSGNDNAA